MHTHVCVCISLLASQYSSMMFPKVCKLASSFWKWGRCSFSFLELAQCAFFRGVDCDSVDVDNKCLVLRGNETTDISKVLLPSGICILYCCLGIRQYNNSSIVVGIIWYGQKSPRHTWFWSLHQNLFCSHPQGSDVKTGMCKFSPQYCLGHPLIHLCKTLSHWSDGFLFCHFKIYTQVYLIHF